MYQVSLLNCIDKVQVCDATEVQIVIQLLGSKNFFSVLYKAPKQLNNANY